MAWQGCPVILAWCWKHGGATLESVALLLLLLRNALAGDKEAAAEAGTELRLLAIQVRGARGMRP